MYNELEGKGLFGLSGTLTIQPEYQRNYIYADGKRDVAARGCCCCGAGAYGGGAYDGCCGGAYGDDAYDDA
jgi:hypothetical protein